MYIVEVRMNGLWTVEFGSNAGLFGSGVIVMRDGRIEGGDDSYYYIGSYEPVLETTYPISFKATLSVRPFLTGRESVFRTFNKDLTLKLVGTFNSENSAVAVGTPEGMPEMNLGVRLTRKTG
jgi:hypothetical protein